MSEPASSSTQGSTTKSNVRSTRLPFIGLLALSFLWNLTFFTQPGTYGIFDWHKDLFFLEVHHHAISEYGEIPLGYFFVPDSVNWSPTLEETFSTIANPEIVKLSPTSLFAPLFDDAVDWFRFSVFLHFIPAIVGILLIARRLGLSLVQTALLYTLTILNPWLMQHIAIGFLPWVNLGLAAFALGIWLDNPRRLRNVVLFGLACACMLWQGGFHLFVWFQLAIGTYLAFHVLLARSLDERRLVLHWLAGLGVAILAALPLLRGSYRVFQEYIRHPQRGIRTASDLYNLLTDTETELYEIPAAYTIHNTNIYDASLVMGQGFVLILGLAVGVFTILSFTKEWRGEEERLHRHLSIILSSCFVFVVLSLDTVWRSLVNFAPIFSSENYPFRFLFVALIFAIYFCIRLPELLLDEELRKNNATTFGVALLVLFIPTLMATYPRNAMFNEVATRSPDARVINDGFREKLPPLLARIEKTSGSINEIRFQRSHDPEPCLDGLSPWKPAPAIDRIVEGGRFVGKGCLQYDPGSQTISIRFRDHGLKAWSILGSLGILGIAGRGYISRRRSAPRE